MYNVDDAIAKIDGYVIAISGGGPFVGERKLIRINEVRRTAAYASLVSENGGGPEKEEPDQPAADTEPPVAHASEVAIETAAAPDQSDGLQSNGSPGRRRRGRRGGRRRSRKVS